MLVFTVVGKRACFDTEGHDWMTVGKREALCVQLEERNRMG